MTAGTTGRVARLEARTEEHVRMMEGLRESVASLEERMERRFDGVDRRFVALEERMERRFDGMDAKISRHFYWMVGIQITTLTAIITALAR